MNETCCAGASLWVPPFIVLVVELVIVAVVIAMSEIYRRKNQIRIDLARTPSNSSAAATHLDKSGN